jgi:hypothetical protein
MDTFVANIFTDETTEFTNIQAVPPTIDATDWPLTPSLIASLTPNPNFFVTAPISDHGYFEIEFHLGNNFWGVNMNFGNAIAGGANPGREIRQGIAHLLDKTKFTANQPNIAGVSIPIDVPVPPSNGGLPSPNPCAWDTLPGGNPVSPSCAVGATGGLAYHLAPATAGVGPSVPTFSWTPGLGTSDFCIAADHFIAAGLATGKNPTTCVLTGINPAVSTHTVNVFDRIDNPPRFQAGNSIVEALCALFTGTFQRPCAPFVTETSGPITAFCGFTTSPTSVGLCWWIYTGGFGNVFPFDSSLFFGYNSRFVSGAIDPVTGAHIIQPPLGPCSSLAVPSFGAGDYQYVCDSTYDTLTTNMEFAPCLAAAGDPTPGQVTPTFAQCPGTTSDTAISAGYKSEDRHGSNAYTIPLWSGKNQFGYLSTWSRAINHEGNGLANFFTWLNAWNSAPAVAGTIRQGFKETTKSVSPYIADTIWDFFIAGNIYDSLNVVNPRSNGQLMEWMTVSSQQLSNPQLTYTPPPGTVSTFRFTLRGTDLFWHDGRQVTSWDVKFSYRTLKDTGAFQSGGLAPMTDITVLSPTQFDIGVSAFGPFTKLFITGPTIFPGRYWSQTCSGVTWDNAVAAGNVPASCNVADTTKIIPAFDPLVNGILIGSGPSVCKSLDTAVVGTRCAKDSTGAITSNQNPAPGGSYNLARNGAGSAPGASLKAYFRSSGAAALWIWSGNTGDFTHDFLNFGVVARCFGQPLPAPPIPTTGCGHWQQGLGVGFGAPPRAIDGVQVGIVSRFVGVNWISPFDWRNPAAQPVDIAAFPPVLYEGSATLNPASLVGCPAGYDC